MTSILRVGVELLTPRRELVYDLFFGFLEERFPSTAQLVFGQTIHIGDMGSRWHPQGPMQGTDLDPFAADRKAPKKPHALKPWPKPAPKIALGDFVIDPLPALAAAPEAPAAKPEPGAQQPSLRTVVNY